MGRVIDLFSCDDNSDFFNKNAVVSGYLVIRGRECFLVGESRYPFPDSRVEIYCPGLEASLDSVVGGWVGGVASYFDEVTIHGVVGPGTTCRDVASISKISKIALIRDEFEYEIIPDVGV